MQRLYGTYPHVSILKTQLYRTHDSSHDRTGFIRMNATFYPINKQHYLLDSLQQMDSHYRRYSVNDYNVDKSIIRMLIPKNGQSLPIPCELLQCRYVTQSFACLFQNMAIHSKNGRANTSVNVSHVRSYHQHPQAQNFNLPICVVFVASSFL